MYICLYSSNSILFSFAVFECVTSLSAVNIRLFAADAEIKYYTRESLRTHKTVTKTSVDNDEMGTAPSSVA